jgi:hypothetical protein
VDEPHARFSEAHRNSIGVALSQLAELLAVVRRAGLAEPHIGLIEEQIEATARATGARRPRPRHGALNAALVQMLVLEEELRSRRMTGYGPLTEDAAGILDANVQRLVDLTNDLIDDVQRSAG